MPRPAINMPLFLARMDHCCRFKWLGNSILQAGNESARRIGLQSRQIATVPRHGFTKKPPERCLGQWQSFGIGVAPAVGFEPTTNRLTADRSTTELRWINSKFGAASLPN